MLHGDAIFFYRRRLGGTCTVVNWRTEKEVKFLTRPVGTVGDFPVRTYTRRNQQKMLTKSPVESM